MAVPSRASFLKELDALPYGQRVERAARLGREARGDPALPKLTSELLSTGTPYEGSVALSLAIAARDEATLLGALGHSSRRVRLSAASACARWVEDEAALEKALSTSGREVARKLLENVGQARRRSLASRLIAPVLERHGAAEAAKLLRTLDHESARNFLPRVGHAVRGWHALVRSHPDLVLAFVREAIVKSPARERASRFAEFREALSELTLERSAEVLALVSELAPKDSLPGCIQDALPRLTRRHPAAMFELVIHADFRSTLKTQGLPRRLLSEAARFSSEHRAELARALSESPRHLAAFLEALPPASRPELFDHAFAEARPKVLPESLLEVLPTAARDREAARQLEEREIRDRPDRVVDHWALRNLEVAREPLAKAAFSSDADERAEAWVALVRCTGLERAGLSETLRALGRLKNEQDPVRLPVIGAVARLPLSLFEDAHVPALEALVEWVVEARDTSYGTRSHLIRLAFRLMAHHASTPERALFGFALDTLERLAGQSGGLELPPLWPVLPRGAEHHLFSTLLPKIRAAAEREDFRLVLALARALGPRAWDMDMLQAMLEPATQARPDVFSGFAVGLWLASPRTRDLRVRKLLDRDASSVQLPDVFAHLHRRRQDWLDPFLEGRPLAGRYGSENTGWVPSVSGGFHRWLPRQQERLAALLSRIAADGERGAWERMGALAALSTMEVTTVETFRPFLASGDVPAIEAALAGMARMDRPEAALPLLSAELSTDRARVAIDALGKVARTLAPERLSKLLDETLAREDLKVTSRKSLVRTLGALRTGGAMALLRREWGRPKLHRDVWICVGQAARGLLDDAGAWELLAELSESADPYVAGSLLEQDPRGMPEKVRERYGALLLRLAGHPELTVRRRVLGGLVRWSAGAEEAVAKVAAGRAVDLEGGAEWREALQTLVQVTQDGPGFEHLVGCAEWLGRASVRGDWDAGIERDLPARQRLKVLVETVLGLPWAVRRGMEARLSELTEPLKADASLFSERAALRLASLEWGAVDGPAARLRELVKLSASEPLFAQRLAALVTDAVGREVSAPEALLGISDEVVEIAPLVALALVRIAGERLSWREDAAKRLRTLRGHPNAGIRAAARETFTRKE